MVCNLHMSYFLHNYMLLAPMYLAHILYNFLIHYQKILHILYVHIFLFLLHIPCIVYILCLHFLCIVFLSISLHCKGRHCKVYMYYIRHLHVTCKHLHSFDIYTVYYLNLDHILYIVSILNLHIHHILLRPIHLLRICCIRCIEELFN